MAPLGALFFASVTMIGWPALVELESSRGLKSPPILNPHFKNSYSKRVSPVGANALSDYGGGRQIHIWLGQLEEAFKVYSEAFFILAFYAILKNINTRQKQVFKEVNSPQISESVGRRS